MGGSLNAHKRKFKTRSETKNEDGKILIEQQPILISKEKANEPATTLVNVVKVTDMRRSFSPSERNNSTPDSPNQVELYQQIK